MDKIHYKDKNTLYIFHEQHKFGRLSIGIMSFFRIISSTQKGLKLYKIKHKNMYESVIKHLSDMKRKGYITSNEKGRFLMAPLGQKIFLQEVI